ncbi:hypothetical protein Poli38472_012459 [Pythium oligandrum]|uniref:PAP-associated domain-containing protein n=1 Tax=Pythium oligandrum TaxID=41045 RepID=A0A8K1CS63_PYTOL|nr:hypothetical protein Poli38472_012459 [Pythium oligandrum]|eukprot:TMW67343.1 hypothetical protein Poli38472_012459 [Pythium oligandrum]
MAKMEHEEQAAMTEPPRKRARRGKRKSKAERLARGLNAVDTSESTSDARNGAVTMETLQSLLDAPTSTSSIEWDHAQSMALRLGSSEARCLMVFKLLFDRQAPRAVGHYAKRLHVTSEELLQVLESGRNDAARAIQVAKLLIETETDVVSNEMRLERFILPWLEHSRVDPSRGSTCEGEENDDDDQQNDAAAASQAVASSFSTALRLVLQRQTKFPDQQLALQRLLLRALRESLTPKASWSHPTIAFTYAGALLPLLQQASESSGSSGVVPSVWEPNALAREQMRRLEIARRVETQLQMLWQDARVLVFGSSVTGLLSPDSETSTQATDDVDLCVVLPSLPSFQHDTASTVVEMKEHLGMYISDVMAVSGARIPIVRWVDPMTKLQCDLCVNNLPALWNTQLIRCLVRVDDVVRDFALWMKQWHRAKKPLFGASLSSYGMLLLVLHFLQHRGVLPYVDCSTLVPPTATADEATQALNSVEIEDIESRVRAALHTQTTGSTIPTPSCWSLIVGFFAYYGAGEFDYEHDVVALRCASLCKRDKAWIRKSWRYALSIEDPIETERDLGTLFTRATLTRFRCAILESSLIIADCVEENEATLESSVEKLRSILERILQPVGPFDPEQK